MTYNERKREVLQRLKVELVYGKTQTDIYLNPEQISNALAQLKEIEVATADDNHTKRIRND